MATVNGTANNDVLFIDQGKSNDTLLGLAGNDYLDALPGAGNNILRGGEGDDELYAYTNDQLDGDAGNDSLTSDGNGNNTLAGGDGNDTIYADRNDTVSGDVGDDKIYGGQGGNTLTGGAGKDVFWIANADVPTTPNTITDFDRLNDTIRLNLVDVKTLGDLTIAKSGSDATISFGTQQLALIKNTAPGSLNSNTVAVDNNAPNNAGSNVTSYEFTNLPKLGTTSKGQDLFLGGFSGLYFQGIAANGNLKFVTNTDRGPNGEPTGANRPFLLPNFQPEIVSFELNRTSGEISITKRTGLFAADGKTPLTGLPNLQAAANGLAYTDEIGVDLDGKVLTNDPLGADVEGIVIGTNGDYWLVDEYRPAIYHFDPNGKLVDRFIPKGTATAPTVDFPAGTFGTEVLPAVYAQRRSNRGFEAVAIDGYKLYAFIQSPIDNPDNAGDTASRASRTVRILEFDTLTNTVTGEYLYLLDDITGTGNAKTDKLGDAVSLGNGKFAVVERDDLATTASNKLIYQIDLATATNIHNPANFTLPTGKTIEQLTPAELATAKITTAPKSLIANAAKLGYTGVEKLEGLALVAPNTLALINDNDFNVAAGSKVPEKLGILELSKSLPVTGIIGTQIINSTGSADLLLGVKETNTRMIGDRRNNIIDVSIASGSNQIYAGDGADELYAGKTDRLFGEGGNDILDATDGQGGNTLDGGSGDDQLFAGTNDRLFGGEGSDQLFAGMGGNTLTGGNGKDIFILAATTLPTQVNTITDFKAGTDTFKIVGIPNLGDDITKLTAIQQGDDTLLKAGEVDLALIKGIGANSITEVLTPITPARNDFNGDGKSDILWRNTDGSIATWQMNGSNPPKTNSIEKVTPDWTIAGTSDFNNDGKSDILWRNTDGSIATWQMNGGAVTKAVSVEKITADWMIAGTADFTGDGNADILLRNTDGSLALWQIDNSTVTKAISVEKIAADWTVAGTADFNGDGKADILFQNTNGSVALWQMNGAIVASASIIGAPTTDWKVNGTADFNGDGKADILFRNTNGSLALWQMNGATVTSTSTVGAATADWKITGTGDFNGDRNADILWRNDLGSVATWQMNGSTVLAAGSNSIPPISPSWTIAAPIL